MCPDLYVLIHHKCAVVGRRQKRPPVAVLAVSDDVEGVRFERSGRTHYSEERAAKERGTAERFARRFETIR